MSTQQNQTQEIVLSSDQEKLLSDLYSKVPKPRQLSWLQLSSLKMTTEKQLEGKILEIQQALLNWETMELIPLQEALAKAKKLLNEIPDLRKSFTRYIDKIASDLMAIEKRAEGLEILASANKKELELRLKKEADDSAATNKATELAKFKAHVQNEYIRISSEYKIALNNKINQSYIEALEQEFTNDGLIQFINNLASELKAIQKSSPVRFSETIQTPLLNTTADLTEAHKAIPAPNYDEILTKAIAYLPEKFKMYDQDKQNKDLAISQTKLETQQQNEDITSTASKYQAVNNLVGKGVGTTIVDTLPGAKKVKRKKVIVLQDTAAETIKILSLFIAHWDEAAPKLKVKSYAKLDIQKMTAALQELDGEFEGLVYEEIKK